MKYYLKIKNNYLKIQTKHSKKNLGGYYCICSNTRTVWSENMMTWRVMSLLTRAVVHSLQDPSHLTKKHKLHSFYLHGCSISQTGMQKLNFFEQWLWSWIDQIWICSFSGMKSSRFWSTTDGWCLCVQRGCSRVQVLGTCLGAYHQW